MKRPTYCRCNAVTLAAVGALGLNAGALAQEPPPVSPQHDRTTQHEQTTPDTASERYESSTHSATRETTRTESTEQAERSRERMNQDQERTESTAGPADQDQSFAAAELRIMDVDKDGSVSMREHEAGARRMFEKMDADQNGEVTSAEMQASSGAMPSASDPSTASAPAQAKIAAVDRNADGKLTAHEHAEASHDMFGQLDGDRDGALSPNEIQIGRDMMRTTEQPTSRQ